MVFMVNVSLRTHRLVTVVGLSGLTYHLGTDY